MERTPQPAAMHEPMLEFRAEQAIVPEPVPRKMFDNVFELAKLSVIVGVLVEFEGMDRSPAHTPATEGELLLESCMDVTKPRQQHSVAQIWYMWITRGPDVGRIWADTMLLSGKELLIL
ncbi:hypothetical protein DPX16_8774 [Anabarilius grahami]|uniref:Uncharacterized protein n=1 Tax=Anabarilius grahami TaxID=495550 RepID=A0A3N0YDR0_ANAGA|nr:hypothetical protein DPX16_8774 [Anabarilius grahami]